MQDFRGYFSNMNDDFCFILKVFVKQLSMANQTGWEGGLEGLLLVTSVFSKFAMEISLFINDNMKIKRLSDRLTNMNTTWLTMTCFEESELRKLIVLPIMASTASKICITLIIYRNFQIELVSICPILMW